MIDIKIRVCKEIFKSRNEKMAMIAKNAIFSAKRCFTILDKIFNKFVTLKRRKKEIIYDLDR